VIYLDQVLVSIIPPVLWQYPFYFKLNRQTLKVIPNLMQSQQNPALSKDN
jgi:hypothetical protein